MATAAAVPTAATFCFLLSLRMVCAPSQNGIAVKSAGFASVLPTGARKSGGDHASGGSVLRSTAPVLGAVESEYDPAVWPDEPFLPTNLLNPPSEPEFQWPPFVWTSSLAGRDN